MPIRGAGENAAGQLLDSGAAWRKLQAICETQGGLRVPGEAIFRRDIVAAHAGRVIAIDNRHIARTAKLAGAPMRQVAGLEMRVRVNDEVRAGQPLFTVHAQASGELDYSCSYALAHPAVSVEPH